MSIPRIPSYPMPDRIPAGKTGWTIQPRRAALLVHDMQQYFVDFFDTAQPPMPELIANIGKLLDACRAASVPVVYTAQPGDQDPRERALLTDFWGKGLAAREELVRILPALAPQPGDTVMTKWRYSAFKKSSLEQWLADQGRDQLIICGVYAHIGCLMTAAEAFMLDIQAFLVGDALADFSLGEHEQALEYAAGRCAQPCSVATALAALAPAPGAILSAAQLREDVAEQLGVAPQSLRHDDDLLLAGLDSVRLMVLIERWRAQGATLDFAQMAQAPTLAAWSVHLCGLADATPPHADTAADTKAMPLTQAQLGVLQGQRMAGDESVFYAAECIEIEGALDVRLFEAALKATLDEARSLHLSVFEQGGEWRQQIGEPQTRPLIVRNRVGICEQELQAEITRELARPFDPQAGYLFDHQLYRINATRHCWLHRAHHLLLDGYGFQMISRRVAEHYSARLRGVALPSAGYGALRAVVDADHAYQRSPEREADRRFWLDTLAGKQPLSLSKRPTEGIARGQRHAGELAQASADLLKLRASEFGLSWPELLTAGFAGYLATHGHGRDVVLGMPVMQRLGTAALRTPCTAMNVMPLPVADAAQQPLAVLAGSVRMTIQQQRPHSRYRFEHLEHDLEVAGYPRGLLATELNVMPFEHPAQLGPCRLDTRILAAGPVEDLAAVFTARGNAIGFDLDGRAENYAAGVLAAHTQAFGGFLAQWLDQPWVAAAELV